jgi:hypothetical protein
VESLNGMVQVLALGSGISVIVLILLQLLKKTAPSFDKGGESAKYLPVIAILIGLVAGFAVYPFTDMDLTLRLWAGFFAGAGASGLYDLKKTIK